ncbi:MAG TPA: hypothetical protein VMT11_16650, partial [Myxococcaceae bacterium]|nr:hypothetical protein [Myxococcaceae bacterium]
RKRQPDDVPTPVAVAVSDFCRRAGAPASPRAVREALSLLAESDDFRVRAVTDAEPPVRPLGPFAAVDLARGTPADITGLRERSGYYALVEEMLALQDARAPAPADTPGTVAPVAPAPAPAQTFTARPQPETVAHGSTSRGDDARPPTVAERIAPRRRAAQSPAPPRGRFTQVEAQRATLESLEAPEGRATLQTLLAQHGHRPALVRALAQGYVGERGDPSASELDALLAAQGLLDAAEASECELILAAVSEQRGALGRVAWALGLRGQELTSLVSRLGLGPEVERRRERFRREALSPASWTARLDLFGRRKYLEDLGVERDFEDRLRGDLARELAAAGADAGDAPAALARRLGVSQTLVTRALERLGLLPEANASTTPT